MIIIREKAELETNWSAKEAEQSQDDQQFQKLLKSNLTIKSKELQKQQRKLTCLDWWCWIWNGTSWN